MVAVPASVASGVTVFVPVPSAALFTVTNGCEAMFASAPPAGVERSLVVQLAAPVVVVAMPARYVIVTVWPTVRVSAETVIVWPATEMVPVLVVTCPAPAPSCGAVQPAGTSIVTTPLVMPPVAAV